MGKEPNALERTKIFISDVKTELKKSAWPTKSELIESTLVIIWSVIMLGIFLGVSDWLLMRVVGLLVR